MNREHKHDPLCPVATVYDAMGDRPKESPAGRADRESSPATPVNQHDED